jgi:hypothetical protein
LFSDADDSPAKQLVSGNPLLTSQMVNRGIRLFEWLLDAQLTIEQRAQFRDSHVDSWKANRRDDIDATVNVLNFQDQLSQKTPEEQRLLREVLLEKYLDQMRQTPNEVLSRWVLNIYDSAHRPIADGNPPLTAQVVDAYAELVSFVVNECLQNNTVKADRHFKDQLAESLIREYSTYSTEQQHQLSRMPLLWKELRLKWTQLSEPQRALFRKLYKQEIMSQLIESQLRSSRTATRPSTGGDDSLQHYFDQNNEHLFVKTMSQSSFATTMSLHLNMWK